MEINSIAKMDESKFGRYNVVSFLRYYIKSFERAIRHEQQRIGKVSENETLMSDMENMEVVMESHEEAVLSAVLKGSLSKTYSIDDIEITIHDENLIIALDSLPPKKRNVILLSYCTPMNDREIGKRMHITRNTVINRRADGISIMQQIMEEIN